VIKNVTKAYDQNTALYSPSEKQSILQPYEDDSFRCEPLTPISRYKCSMSYALYLLAYSVHDS